MWEKILVPLDGSELAERVLFLVRRILERRSVLTDEDAATTQLKLLRVVSRDELDRGERLGRGEVALARSQLESSLRQLGGIGAGGVEVVVGDPAADILTAADRWSPTLIAMTTHGRTGLESLVRGSVAERVLRFSHQPLLLANPFALDSANALPFQKILVPIDGSEHAVEVLPRVAAVASFFDAEVVLLHVVPVVPVEDELGALRVRDAEASEALERARALLPGARVRARLDYGAPAASILQAIAEEDADLLALTTHGRSGPSRWQLGSVAENVLRQARCPLLVQRTRSIEERSSPVGEEAKHVA
jgi:nucleotide-binding universal stress UspA family protein